MQHARFWTKRVVAAALLLLALATPSPTTRAQDAEVDMALVLAVDCSFSVDFREFALQMRGLGEAFRKPEIKRAIAMGNLQRIAVSVVQCANRRLLHHYYGLTSSNPGENNYGLFAASDLYGPYPHGLGSVHDVSSRERRFE